MKMNKMLLSALLLGQSAAASAQFINFPVGTTIEALSVSTPFGNRSYVEVDAGDYTVGTIPGLNRGLSINSSTIFPVHSGGIYNGNLFGQATPLEITRRDGGAFSFESFTVLEKVGLPCPFGCVAEPFRVEGYAPGSTTAFSVLLHTDNNNQTYNLLNVLAADARFGNVEKVVVYEDENFILDAISVTAAPVSAVPVPAAAWLFGSGLLGLLGVAKRRRG